MHIRLIPEIAVVILHSVICCLNICRDDLSHSCGTNHDVYFLSSTVTDIISTANIFLIKIKTISVIFWSTKKKLIDFLSPCY